MATGRSDDMIILRGVNLFPSQIEEIVLRTDGLAPHFQIELTKRDRLDHLIIRAEAPRGGMLDSTKSASRSESAW